MLASLHRASMMSAAATAPAAAAAAAARCFFPVPGGRPRFFAGGVSTGLGACVDGRLLLMMVVTRPRGIDVAAERIWSCCLLRNAAEGLTWHRTWCVGGASLADMLGRPASENRCHSLLKLALMESASMSGASIRGSRLRISHSAALRGMAQLMLTS